MAAEASLKIVREILSACNEVDNAEIAAKVPSMLRILSQSISHADRRVRYACVSAFSAIVKNYKDQTESASQYIKELEAARSSLAENHNDGDLENLEVLNSAMEALGISPKQIPSSSPAEESEYLDTFIEPQYVAEESSRTRNRIHGMILRLSSTKTGTVPSAINAAVIQMRMVLVAGVISASLRIEKNDSAEEADDDSNSTVAKIFLSVKVAPTDDDFVEDLNSAIVDATDGSFKLASVDFWENHSGKSGKDTPADTVEKSTEFADSEYMDDGMYLDDDDKLGWRATGKKKGASKPRRPWSMFNPSSALGLNSVFNSDGLLEMIEYDSEEAVAARGAGEKPAPAVAPEPAPVTGGRFGLLKRLFG
jgi:hypothetical protein